MGKIVSNIWDMNKSLFIFLVLMVIYGCANRSPTYQNNYTSNYSNNSIPTIQYDASYKAGCNRAIFTDAYGSYDGNFCYGKKKGAGIETYKNPPSKYDGMFNNDLREGYGVYTWYKTNTTYAGYWKNGRQNGYGTYTWAADGDYATGYWVNGVEEGEQKLYKKDGTLLITGYYKNGKLISSTKAGGQTAKVDYTSKTQKCKRLGLIEGSEDFKLCLNSVKN
ncbi:hypothetical protein G6658_03555 [Polynucleobacter paneuropaeus]|nr:hypothetical protein G6658_03555 [Polynucleobacter paneuropaeus]